MPPVKRIFPASTSSAARASSAGKSGAESRRRRTRGRRRGDGHDVELERYPRFNVERRLDERRAALARNDFHRSSDVSARRARRAHRRRLLRQGYGRRRRRNADLPRDAPRSEQQRRRRWDAHEPTPYGIFSMPITFSKQQALGYYTIDAKGANGNDISGSLRVAEFKPPNFKLTLNLGATSATAGGERARERADAAYLFGAPLQGGTAHAYVTRDSRDRCAEGVGRLLVRPAVVLAGADAVVRHRRAPARPRARRARQDAPRRCRSARTCRFR